MKIEISSGAKKDLKKLEKKVSIEIIKEAFPLLQQNPTVGNELSGNLKGLWSYHLIQKGIHYRIIYEIQEEIIGIILIAPRENVYKKLKKRM